MKLKESVPYTTTKRLGSEPQGSSSDLLRAQKDRFDKASFEQHPLLSAA